MALKSLAIVSQAFEDEDVSSFILYTICFGKFGADIHEWEPETLWLEIQDEFKIDPLEENKDKIQAAISLVVTNRFYEDYQAFEAICKAFNKQNPDFEWATPLTPEECAWAVAESRLIDSTPETFSLEVKTYVKEALRLGGLFMAPPQLSFCNIGTDYPLEKYVSKEMYPKIIRSQKIKLKKIELYVELQREKIGEDLKNYFQ
jgi:hypothetical protein